MCLALAREGGLASLTKISVSSAMFELIGLGLIASNKK